MRLVINNTKKALTRGLLFCAISCPLLLAFPVQVMNQLQQSKPTRLMEFIGFNWEDVISRLDYLDHYLRGNGGVKAYIFVYGGRRENAPESIDARMRCVEEYLRDRRGTASVTFEVLKGGYRERPTIEFWVSSMQGQQPEPSATVSKKSVRYRHRRDKNIKVLCNN
jgi:hypothetical protein